MFDRSCDRIRRGSTASSKPAGAATCTTAPPPCNPFPSSGPSMTSNIETTYDTSLSSNILASLASGTMEIRERLLYNPQANTLTSTVFLVPPGSPIPTPASVDITAMTLASYTISIDRTYTSCSPYPSVMFAGTITSSSGGASAPNGIYNLTFSGTPAAVSIGYTTDNPPQINNVVTLFAGIAVSYSPAGYRDLDVSRESGRRPANHHQRGQRAPACCRTSPRTPG